ncbi:class I SAM-dependent methyltransferase [Pseudonocardia sp. TRM90224]|uniref:class I SAM-dependent methyltransferase n=1 Tax=Pseudonocardia sp. TRM90224 TaxID=2812678 RepID=UPI001E43117B|nr:class I SAM-dependent methyltransferase [Pseudonocardia sp. TRM90224]
MTTLDWGLGSFETIAPQLHPAAREVVAVAGAVAGEHVVDVGCGTGSAALFAARPGVLVTGVDPAARLLEVAREQAVAAGRDVTFVAGEAARLPLADGQADVLISNFGLIFAPDPALAAAEITRVAAEAARIVYSAWLPGGPFGAINDAAAAAAAPVSGANPIANAFPWHDAVAAAGLFGHHGFEVAVHSRRLTFSVASPQVYWQEMFLEHPLGRMLAPLMEAKGLMGALEHNVMEVLERINEDPDSFRFTAPYVIVEARR